MKIKKWLIPTIALLGAVAITTPILVSCGDNKTIQEKTYDIVSYKFNTTIEYFGIWLNNVYYTKYGEGHWDFIERKHLIRITPILKEKGYKLKSYWNL